MSTVPDRARGAGSGGGDDVPAGRSTTDTAATDTAAVSDAAGPAGQPESADSGRMRRTQVRGSALLVGGRIFTMVLTTATQVVVVRALTKADFGAFAYALAIATAGQTLLSLGQGRLLSRFMAKYEEQRDYDRMFGAMVLAVGTIAVTSILLLGLMFLIPGQLIPTQDPDTVQVVLILVFLAPIQALDQVFVSLFAVFSAPGAIFFRKYLFTPGLRLVVVVLLAATGSSVTFLAIGYVLTGVIGLVVSMAVFLSVLRERGLLSKLHPSRIRVPYRDVFSFSMPLITGEVLLMSFTVGGVLILGHYQSASEVAIYRAVFNPSRLNTAVLGAFVPLFLPLAARLFERDDVAGLRRAYWHTGAFVAVLTFPIFALTGPLAPSLVGLLFGERYAASGPVLALLSVGYYFSTVLGFNAYTLQVCGRIRFLVGVNIGVAALNVGLCFALVEPLGALGIAVANLIALVVQNLLQQWALRGALGTAFVDRGCAWCYLVIAACAAALWALQELVDPNFVVAFLAASVASLVVLLASRRAIELADTFPELRRLPLVGRLLT
jgi:O-antigen/teichoic acid export membrane protein